MNKILNILYVISFFWFIQVLLKLNTHLKNGDFKINSYETIESLIFIIIIISFFIYYRKSNSSNES